MEGEQVGDPPMAQKNLNMGETPPPQDAEVSLNFLIGSEVVLMCGLQTDREKAPSPRPRNPTQPSPNPQLLGNPLFPVLRLPFPNPTPVTMSQSNTHLALLAVVSALLVLGAAKRAKKPPLLTDLKDPATHAGAGGVTADSEFDIVIVGGGGSLVVPPFLVFS